MVVWRVAFYVATSSQDSGLRVEGSGLSGRGLGFMAWDMVLELFEALKGSGCRIVGCSVLGFHVLGVKAHTMTRKSHR